MAQVTPEQLGLDPFNPQGMSEKELIFVAAYYTKFLSSSGAGSGSGFLNKINTVNGIQGGGSNLEAVVTNGVLAPGDMTFFLVGGLLNVWYLRSGTDASDGISVQRPSDYNAATNAVVWQRIL